MLPHERRDRHPGKDLYAVELIASQNYDEGRGKRGKVDHREVGLHVDSRDKKYI